MIGRFHTTDERMIGINGVRHYNLSWCETERLLKIGINNLSDLNCLPLSVNKDS